MKPVIIIAIASVLLFVPISNVSAFESEFYDGFFISYGGCNVVIDTDIQILEMKFSQTIDENFKELYCDLLENSKFEYDSITSEGLLTKMIKYDQEGNYTFYTDGVYYMPYILQKHWNQGDSLNKEIDNIPELKYLVLGTKEINGKSLTVHEFAGKSYLDETHTLRESHMLRER